MTLNYVQNDTAPGITFNVTRSGKAVDLTGATVKFKIQDPDDLTETNAAHNTCTIVLPATNGQCTYAILAGDIPNAKVYQCDLSITWANSTVETSYQQVFLNVRAAA